MRTNSSRITWAMVLLLLASSARAEPWLSPGDEILRQDVQLLADSGILTMPVTTWPLSWSQVARDLANPPSADSLDEATLAALARVQRRAQAAATPGGYLGMRLSGAHEPVRFRGFEDTPREEGEVRANASWMGQRLAFNLQAAAVSDPDDGQQLRLDGSYLAVNVANVALGGGYVDAWWGPGWNGSLIYSTNARPMPGVFLARNYAEPFKSRWLSWIGPWTASASLSEGEAHGLAVGKVRFLAMRVNFKPRPWLEFGLSRTAQWCGTGRPCGWGTLQDLLLGRDNQVDNGSVDGQPGNQMAGYDMRLRSPWRALPLVFYGQLIGEDEAGAMPAKFLGLFGLESWASTPLGALRAHFEYSDTACSFSRQDPDFDCAYRNGVYPQGYTFRGRVIGHSMDNDSRMYSLSATLVRPGGDSFGLTLRQVELNRDGGPHSISEVPLDLYNVELRYSRIFGSGKFAVGVGFDDGDETVRSNEIARGFVTWQQGF